MPPGIVLGISRPDFLLEETLAEVFRMSAQKHASKTALIFDDRSVTYGELDRWSDAMALYLSEKGIKPGDAVGLWWPRSLELHVAVLGIVKCGAAYVPLDREMPAERVETVLNEVQAKACISDGALNIDCPVFGVVGMPAANTTISLVDGPAPDNWAYVLYTSGSTGKPKGIPITHRMITHFVRAEQSVLNIRTTDKVYQGFSVSFDMWCEEVWISYFVGATMWVADATTTKSIDELDEVLRRQHITVLHTVPSLLAVMNDDVPLVRLVNAGGEACTAQVVSRWSVPPRQFFNSYGPTETTVTATITTLKPGEPITIGQPLPNYNLAVVDEQLNLLPVGERGELVITGPGVSHGYVNRPDLTIEKFVAKPESLSVLPGDFVYKTGDAAIINPDRSIDFQGRLDDQIKLRGYRIELGEIENQLSNLTDITAAAVAVKKDINGQDHLAGYVVCDDPVNMNQQSIRDALAKVLPAYMVPSVIVQLSEMPRLPSGKINRKELPVPAMLMESSVSGADDIIDIDAPLGDRVIAALRKNFPNRQIDGSLDFFTDLGGHSLLAASFVSRLRKEANIPQASLKDIYLNRPLGALINYWESKKAEKPKEKKVFNQISKKRFYMCWAAQTLSLLLMYGLFAVQIFFPYLGYYGIKEYTGNIGLGIATALGVYFLIPPFFATLSILVKWLVIGKMKEGDYPLWGGYYFRWWFVKTFQRLLPSEFLNGTPLYCSFLRRMGVTVAKDTQLAAITIGAEDLVSIGSDASLSSQVVINNAWVEDGLLKLRKVHIGAHAYIGSSAIIAGGATVEDWGELQDLSYLQEGKTIKSGEIWQGSPAVLKQTKPIDELPQPIFVSNARRRTYKVIFLLLLLLFPFVILLPLLPTVIILNDLDNSTPDYDFSYMIVTPSLALSYIIIFSLVTIGLTRLLQRGIKPGKYPIYSGFYLRKWFADQLMSLSLIVLHPIYATVFVSIWFRALGAKVGKNTEISTASSVTHPLLEIGKNAFVADAVTLGESDVRGQQLILEKTIIGNNSFVGNSALIPQGYHLPGRMLIGVLSTPPDAQQLEGAKAKDWFGSPAIALPRRQESRTFPAEQTLRPSPQRILGRTIVEFIRILIPETTIIICSILFIAYSHDLLVEKHWWEIAYTLPVYYLYYMGLPAFLVTFVMKWVFVRRFNAEQKPMWTPKVWISEAITSTYEALTVPFVLDYMRGTPWLPILLRLMGVKIGKRVWMNTTDITEFDMVSIGDDTALNEDCGPQTHLFEDRVMKVGPIKIGQRCNIGARSIILYDSEIGNDVGVDPLSLVMKGENLQPETNWGGSPVRSA
ncbi:peptide synthetase [Flavipsychrobacter stenotrophus]|uniref:Peptide synthetase n=1 Tax=Flavipsychrobacter stenotrophus TaxID=2077091 RepID=A0A2S7SQ93_9BACT|nr:Pls/PosA family non-ribosomal peptide synthetase [Flavipsychrobacter stenotrophus]PQJ09072.1 peptide synthetase [Flavipsychrobacter stenotrophus]